MATLQLHVSAVAGAARRQHVILQQQLAWDSHSAGLQGGQSQAQRELAKQAMRLEILLGQAALGQPELLQHLQVQSTACSTLLPKHHHGLPIMHASSFHGASVTRRTIVHARP
jgi:hypothetical protein